MLTATVSMITGGVLIGLTPIVTHAAPAPDLLSPDAASEEFGGQVLVLSNGNYVVVDALFDTANHTDVGAVYLYNGATDTVISRLTGTQDGDQVGSDGVTEVGTSDVAVLSASWHSGTVAVGAATWVNGATGLNAQVSAGNSLIGTSAGDFAGAGVTALANGNYVVSTPSWGPVDIGAVTLANANGTTVGSISSARSLVGSVADDRVGGGGVTALPSGDYVVSSPSWDDGATADVGAVTWASGSAATDVPVSRSNSIVGSVDGDAVGSGGVTALTTGDYVISSPSWDGDLVDRGAATWAPGGGITSAEVDLANSLVGANDFDTVSSGGVTALTNGNYVVSSPMWNNSPELNVGAVTWADGSAAAGQSVTAANSIVGTTSFDDVGSGGVTALSNGDYVVSSPFWSDASTLEVGAATWADGSSATVDEVSPGNSVIGTTDFDHVSFGGVTALVGNGNYVISSPSWDDGATTDVGAATFAPGSGPVADTVSVANSVIGSTPTDNVLRFADQVGSGGITALTDGNYVVSSPFWNGSADGAGAATWGDGALGSTGAVDAGNSLVGNRLDDNVSSGAVIALGGGRYVVSSPLWDHGAGETNVDAGAATLGAGPAGIDGVIDASNSALGTKPVLVLAAADHQTTSDAVVVATTQDRVLRFLEATDFQPPDIVQGDITVTAAPGDTTKVVTFAPFATDNVALQGPVACLPASGSTFNLGTTAVTCTATDTATLTTSKTFHVTVLAADTAAPVLTVPGDISVGTDPGSDTAVVSFIASATDPSGVQSVGCAPTSGSVFPIGITQVTCDASDVLGNQTAPHTFTVTVADDENPVLADVSGNVVVDAAVGATSKVVNFDTPTATDNVGIHDVGCTPTSGTAFPIGVTTVTCTATDVSGLTDTHTFTVTVRAAAPPPPPAAPAGADYVSLTGARLADTRPDGKTFDTRFAGRGVRQAGSTLLLDVAGRGGVAADAAAVALNVTAVDAVNDGFVTVYPCGATQPTASNLNYTSGSIVPNAVVAKIGDGGRICLFVSGTTHLVVDVNGYFPPTTTLHSMNPVRVLETRAGLPTVDGVQQGAGKSAGTSVTNVQVAGRASVPDDATAVVLNVTVTEPDAPGFVTVYPCGGDIPTASSINYESGSTVANLVVAKVGAGGQVCLYSNRSTHLVVDVAGYFPQTTSYHSLVPARLSETRVGASTIDHRFEGAGRREAGTVTELTVVDRAGVPSGAATVVLNVTVTGPMGSGFVTVYPCGAATPLASNLNFVAGATVANAAIVKVGSDGKVCLFNSNATHLVVDVDGFFPT